MALHYDRTGKVRPNTLLGSNLSKTLEVAKLQGKDDLICVFHFRSRWKELFRSFPSPKGWAGHYLEPDLAAYGVLKDRQAALFVEYDGYWRHGEKEGIDRDRLKNAALLAYAPPGSYVLRISHTVAQPFDGNVLSICVDTWRRGDHKSLSRVVKDVLERSADGFERSLHQPLLKQWKLHMDRDCIQISDCARQFRDAAVAAQGGNTMEEIKSFLVREGFSEEDVVSMQQRALTSGQSIEERLQPKLQWLVDLGLSRSQVAKAVRVHPKILSYSIKQNLEPKTQWLLDLGLNTNQIARAVSSQPQILRYSLERNLESKVQWFLNLGLAKTQIAKAVAVHPQLLGLSIEKNLEPKVRWLVDWGLSHGQVAKAVARFPQIFSYSIETNLEPTARWILELGLIKSEISKVIGGFPSILSLSIEQNLQLKLQWFLGLGLSKCQVAKVVALSPPLLALSKERNLEPKHALLVEYFGQNGAAQLIVKFPPVLGCSFQRLEERLNILERRGEKAKLASAMALTEEAFRNRFASGVKLVQKGVSRWSPQSREAWESKVRSC